MRVKRLFLNHLPNLLKTEIARCIPWLFLKIHFKTNFASLNITDRCNLRCIMCKQWRQDKREELNTQDWKNIIYQLKEQGIEEINFTGGEPLLRNDISDLVKYASSLGLICGITTNGCLLDEKTANSLIDSGLSIFTLSIDALGDSYDEIRGVQGVYKRVKDAAEILSDFKKKRNISVHISFVLMKSTLKSLGDVTNFSKELNLSLVVCLLDKTPYLFDLEEEQKNLWIRKDDYLELEKAQQLLFKEKKSNHRFIYNSFSDINFFKDYFKDPIQKNIPCAVSQLRILIDSCGNVYGGCWSLGSFGSLKDKRLIDILNSKHYQKMHKKMFFKNCPGCSCGYSTNLRYNLALQMKNARSVLFSKLKLGRENG